MDAKSRKEVVKALVKAAEALSAAPKRNRIPVEATWEGKTVKGYQPVGAGNDPDAPITEMRFINWRHVAAKWKDMPMSLEYYDIRDEPHVAFDSSRGDKAEAEPLGKLMDMKPWALVLRKERGKWFLEYDASSNTSYRSTPLNIKIRKLGD